MSAEVVNQATATGTADVGGVPTPVTGVSGTDVGNTDPTVVSAGTPSIAFTIDVTGTTDTDLNGRLSPGDLILYGFTVTNTGNVALSNVQVDLSSLFMQLVSADPLRPDTTIPNPLPNLVCNILTLQPGETATFTCTGASYTVRDSDAGAGSLVLNGVAQGTSPASIVVSAASAAAAVAVPDGGTRSRACRDEGGVELFRPRGRRRALHHRDRARHGRATPRRRPHRRRPAAGHRLPRRHRTARRRPRRSRDARRHARLPGDHAEPRRDRHRDLRRRDPRGRRPRHPHQRRLGDQRRGHAGDQRRLRRRAGS